MPESEHDITPDSEQPDHEHEHGADEVSKNPQKWGFMLFPESRDILLLHRREGAWTRNNLGRFCSVHFLSQLQVPQERHGRRVEIFYEASSQIPR